MMLQRRDSAEHERSGGIALALDATAIAGVSVAICTMAQQLSVMQALVPSVIVARTLAWRLLPARERRHGIGFELLLLVGCTLIGGFNDWSSVVRHRVYDYGVPTDLSFSTLPSWMLLYWGLILRFLISLFAWRALGPRVVNDTIALGRTRLQSARFKIALQLALVLVTRQAIYHWYLDPVLSWLPFALALVVYGALFGLGTAERRVLLLFMVGGPLVEMAYIHLGGLHRYHLAWLGGVPLWIALWWGLGALVLRDLSLRLTARAPAAA